jgi:hypothetical protein
LQAFAREAIYFLLHLLLVYPETEPFHVHAKRNASDNQHYHQHKGQVHIQLSIGLEGDSVVGQQINSDRTTRPIMHKEFLSATYRMRIDARRGISMERRG